MIIDDDFPKEFDFSTDKALNKALSTGYFYSPFTELTIHKFELSSIPASSISTGFTSTSAFIPTPLKEVQYIPVPYPVYIPVYPHPYPYYVPSPYSPSYPWYKYPWYNNTFYCGGNSFHQS